MDESTGKWLEGIKALDQTIRRILLTKKASQILNRDFGSRLHEYIDRPLEEAKAYMSQIVFEELEGRIEGYEALEVEHDIDATKGIIKLTVIGNYGSQRTATTI